MKQINMMLKKVFDMDNPLMQGLGMAFNLIVLNIIAMVSALPVVTAGASAVAYDGHAVNLW